MRRKWLTWMIAITNNAASGGYTARNDFDNTFLIKRLILSNSLTAVTNVLAGNPYAIMHKYRYASARVYMVV